MSKTFLPYVGAAVCVALVATYTTHLQTAAAKAPAASGEAAAATRSTDTLIFAAGSPQLAALHIEALHAEAPPLLAAQPGRITFNEDHTVRVYSPVAGKVVRIAVEPGQTVKPGDVLAELLSADADAAVADQRKAQTAADLARTQLQRSRLLHEAGVIATRELEQARTDERTAQAELDRSNARLQALGLGAAASGGRYAIRAPLAGVVAERHLNPGQELRPDATDPAVVITDLRQLDALADIAESDVSKLKVGQTVRVEGEGLNPPLTAHISHIGVMMDANTRRIPVRVHLDAPSAQVRPEMFVRLTPVDTTVPQAVVVPNGAIVTTGQQSHVFVEAQPGHLHKVPVTLLTRGATVSHIAHGVQAGARVVTQGAILLDAELTEGH